MCLPTGRFVTRNRLSGAIFGQFYCMEQKLGRLARAQKFIWNVSLQKNAQISWKATKSNAEVIRLVGSIKSIANIIKERKIRYCGHLMRDDSLQKELLEGKVDGKKEKWFDSIKERTGMGFVECKRIAQNRDDWRKMIADLLKMDGIHWLIDIKV